MPEKNIVDYVGDVIRRRNDTSLRQSQIIDGLSEFDAEDIKSMFAHILMVYGRTVEDLNDRDSALRQALLAVAKPLGFSVNVYNISGPKDASR